MFAFKRATRVLVVTEPTKSARGGIDSMLPSFRWYRVGNEMVYYKLLPSSPALLAKGRWEPMTKPVDLLVWEQSIQVARLSRTLVPVSVELTKPKMRALLKTPVAKSVREHGLHLMMDRAGHLSTWTVASGQGAGQGAGHGEWALVDSECSSAGLTKRAEQEHADPTRALKIWTGGRLINGEYVKLELFRNSPNRHSSSTDGWLGLLGLSLVGSTDWAVQYSEEEDEEGGGGDSASLAYRCYTSMQSRVPELHQLAKCANKKKRRRNKPLRTAVEPTVAHLDLTHDALHRGR